jgi:hypothetical protein
MRCRPLALMSALLVSACSPARSSLVEVPAPAAPALPAEPVEVRLSPYFRELRTLQLTSGNDTLTFLLDTGGGHTLLTTEAAQRLGCTPFGRSLAHRMSGERVEFQWCTGVALALGGVPLEHEKVAVFDLMALLPPVLPRLDGLLSLQSFAHRVVSIDHPGERLVLESDASAATRRRIAEPLVARTATGQDGSTLTLFLAARAEGAPIWLLLDNGNLTGTILSPHALRQIGHRPDAAMEAVEVRGFEVLGLTPATERVQVRDVLYDGVLGASFMQRGLFLFDLRGKDPWVGVHLTPDGRPRS